MKIQRFDFYWSIVTILIAVIVAAAVALFLHSCEPIEALLPDDWPVHVVDPDTIPQDSVVIDTLPTDTIIPIELDTCESLTEHTTPEFVTLYVVFDDQQSNVIWEGGGVQSADLGEVVSAVTSNSFIYGTSSIGGWVIINGTNNHSQFNLKVFTRISGAKWYMGAAKQGLILPGASSEQYKALIQDYPSVNHFSFYGTDYDSTAYVGLCRAILSDCKAGRWYADLFFCPFDLPHGIIDSLHIVGWERVRE